MRSLTERSRAAETKATPERPVLLIPAGMAFGTGDHATTATCLRFLADVADSLAGKPWEMLDLGTGSGILALAARVLGAKRVEAGDFDPDSVRTAKESATRRTVRVKTRKESGFMGTIRTGGTGDGTR